MNISSWVGWNVQPSCTDSLRIGEDVLEADARRRVLPAQGRGQEGREGDQDTRGDGGAEEECHKGERKIGKTRLA